MLPHAFPKILFVNDFPPDSLAVADLVRQLLLGYPQEKIAWWHWRSPRSHRIAGAPVDSVHHFPLPERFLPNRRLAGMKCALMENFWVPRASRHLEQTIQIVKPDLIWVLLYGWPILVGQRARLKNGARLHVSLWDFPDTMAGARILGAARSRRFCDAIFQLVRSADSFDGISRPMLQEIAGQTGRADGLLVHSGFEPADLENLAAADETNSDGVIRLAYVGTIISENSFLKMLAALDKVRPQLSRPVQLEFFGGRGYANRPWFDARWMKEHGIFSDVELVAALRRCSWGIVVMDPEGEDLQYSRFSFPNKVGTYLSAGVPVLGFGHPQSCLGRMMGEHSFGRFTSATDAAALEKFLVEAFQISAPRQLFREDILRVAKTEFNAAEMRARLWQAWAG